MHWPVFGRAFLLSLVEGYLNRVTQFIALILINSLRQCCESSGAGSTVPKHIGWAAGHGKTEVISQVNPCEGT